MKKLAIFFPGAEYGLDCPLLYYSDFLFENNGYERVHMNYQDVLIRSELSLDKRLELMREYIWNQVKDIDFDLYEEVVFLSKSIGAIEAGLLAEKMNVKIRQVFLTPTEDALKYLKEDSAVVIGTNDKAYEMFKSYCDNNQIKALYIEGADHSLEIANQLYSSIQTLERVMRFIEG